MHCMVDAVMAAFLLLATLVCTALGDTTQCGHDGVFGPCGPGNDLCAGPKPQQVCVSVAF
jgi:hypothetical protein